MSKYIEMEGLVFGRLRADKFLGGRYGEWQCTCLECNETFVTRGKYIRNQSVIACKKCSKHLNKEDYIINNNVKYVSNKPKYDMKDMIIGSVTVLYSLGGGLWKCRCSCGKEINVKGFNLRRALESGKDYKCEECSYKDKLDDISGQIFGNWHVDKYLGNGYYECTCMCDKHTKRIIVGKSVKRGASKSCGCLTGELIINNRLNKIGDITNNVKGVRTEEQIKASLYKEYLINFIVSNFDYKPTIHELAYKLGIGDCMMARKIKKFNIENYVDYSTNKSKSEKELVDFIKSICDYDILCGDRDILQGQELDIYIPEKKIAIEFNGTYWHSDIYRDKYYHQQKTIACAKQGIQLIHIFEYEWCNKDINNKIKNYLRTKLNSTELNKVYARECIIKTVDKINEKIFLDDYHLQGYTSSDIALGLYHNNELLGVMTFGVPRFDKAYQYELIRLVYKNDIIVIGGTERMFKYLLKNYEVANIVCYCDISKFTGNTYTRLGFRADKSSLTSPNYVWVNRDKVMSRYQTMKHKLVKQGIGNENQTESEIMESLGFLRIYNSGNLRLTYNK